MPFHPEYIPDRLPHMMNSNFFLKTQLRYHRLSEALSALQAGRTLFPDPCHPLGLLQSRYIHTLLCLFVFVFGCAGSLLLHAGFL